jgi:hypothetical protein
MVDRTNPGTTLILAVGEQESREEQSAESYLFRDKIIVLLPMG